MFTFLLSKIKNKLSSNSAKSVLLSSGLHSRVTTLALLSLEIRIYSMNSKNYFVRHFNSKCKLKEFLVTSRLI